MISAVCAYYVRVLTRLHDERGRLAAPANREQHKHPERGGQSPGGRALGAGPEAGLLPQPGEPVRRVRLRGPQRPDRAHGLVDVPRADLPAQNLLQARVLDQAAPNFHRE